MTKIEQSPWIKNLIERFDALFLHEMTYQLEAGDGWRPIVEGLVARLAALNLPGLRIAQIKQKFYELRCNTEGEEGNPDVAAIIAHFQEMAARTCENCGFPAGHRRCRQYQRGHAREVFDAFGSTGFNVDENGILWCYRPGSELQIYPGDWVLGFADGTLRVAPWHQ
jgi:hypothetical protein